MNINCLLDTSTYDKYLSLLLKSFEGLVKYISFTVFTILSSSSVALGSNLWPFIMWEAGCFLPLV